MKPNDNSGIAPITGGNGVEDAVRQLTQRLDAMLARNLEREFIYQTGDAKGDVSTRSYPKIEGFSTNIPISTPNPLLDYTANCLPKIWRLNANFWLGSIYSGQILMALKIEFGGTSKMDSSIILLPKLVPLPTSYTANTGTVSYSFDAEFPVTYPRMKVTYGSINQLPANPVFTPGLINSTGINGFSQIHLQVLGD